MKLVRRSAAVACALIFSLVGRDAYAGGYLTARYGADDGTPAVPNTFAIYFNPAALGGTKGTTITGDLSLVYRHVSYTRGEDALSPSRPAQRNDPNYVRANTGTNTINNVLALPFAGVNTDFGSKYFRAGFATYIPFGGMAYWGKNDEVTGVPGAVDGPNRWHNISGQILAIYNTLAAAVVLGDTGLSLGASLSGIVHNVATVRARNSDGSDDVTGPTGAIQEGRSYINGWGFNLGAAFGLYWQNKDETARIGLSYTSQPGFGTTNINGTLTQVLSAAQPGADQDVTLKQAYPDIWRLGGTIGLSPRWEVRSDVEYARWRTFDNQCLVQRGAECTLDANGGDPTNKNVILNIPREYRDTLTWRMGPVYKLSQKVSVHGSFGVGTPAVPKKTMDASTIDALTLFFTAGARFTPTKHLGIGVSYNHLYLTNVDTTGVAGQYNYRGPDGRFNVSTSPSAAGKYSSQIGFLNANVSYTF